MEIKCRTQTYSMQQNSSQKVFFFFWVMKANTAVAYERINQENTFTNQRKPKCKFNCMCVYLHVLLFVISMYQSI